MREFRQFRIGSPAATSPVSSTAPPPTGPRRPTRSQLRTLRADAVALLEGATRRTVAPSSPGLASPSVRRRVRSTRETSAQTAARFLATYERKPHGSSGHAGPTGVGARPPRPRWHLLRAATPGPRGRVRASGRVLAISPEDLIVACDMALGHDVPDAEEDLDDRDGLIETYRMVCAEAWAARRQRGDLRVAHLRGPRASRATRAIVSGPGFSVWVATLPCAGGGDREVMECTDRATDGSRRALLTATTGIGLSGTVGRMRPWWADE